MILVTCAAQQPKRWQSELVSMHVMAPAAGRVGQSGGWVGVHASQGEAAGRGWVGRVGGSVGMHPEGQPECELSGITGEGQQAAGAPEHSSTRAPAGDPPLLQPAPPAHLLHFHPPTHNPTEHPPGRPALPPHPPVKTCTGQRRMGQPDSSSPDTAAWAASSSSWSVVLPYSTVPAAMRCIWLSRPLPNSLRVVVGGWVGWRLMDERGPRAGVHRLARQVQPA